MSSTIPDQPLAQNPTPPHHHNGKPELEQHIHAYNPEMTWDTLRITFVVGQARVRGHERPDPGPAQRRVHVGLGPLSGVHARRGRPGRLRTARGNGSREWIEGMDPSGWIGNKGYVGRGMITPHKKPPNGELSETEKEANRSVNRIRRAERAHHRPHQVLENPPHPLPPTPGNIRADHHRSTRTIRLQDHPLNNLPDL